MGAVEPSESSRRLRIATRGSALALWQAEHVAAALREIDAELSVELEIVSTEGDRRTDVPLSAIGGKGVFVKEIQAAVLDGRADLAVHSAKDLPAVTPEGLVIAAIPERADPRDVLVGATLDGLAPGGLVATGSPRRRAQLVTLRPDLRFAELRGNIDTRLARVGEFDAIVMAAAALQRLGRHPDVVDPLPVDVMVPQVGQGALAVECRSDDSAAAALLSRLDSPSARRTVEAERAFLLRLGGDCDLPAGAHATRSGQSIHLAGVLAPGPGLPVHRVDLDGTDGRALGTEVADRLMALVGSDTTKR